MTELAAILNLTPDSFSDGGQIQTEEQISAFLAAVVDAGVEQVDVGACSTRPGAEMVGPKVELERLQPFLAVAPLWRDKIRFSIDTWWSKVARDAIQAGCTIVNDVSCRDDDPALLRVVADSGVGYILMHSRGTPATMNRLTEYTHQISTIVAEIDQRYWEVLAAGVQNSQIQIDPGLGFAKNEETNLMIMQQLDRFRKWAVPLYVGPSRKRFIGHYSGAQNMRDRDAGTLATLALLIDAGVETVRVHDWRQSSFFRRMYATLRRIETND